MPTPKRTTAEQQRARKAANSRAYRKRHAERARAARRRTDAKRRAKVTGKPAIKRESRPKVAKTRRNRPPAPALDPVTGWAAWTSCQ